MMQLPNGDPYLVLAQDHLRRHELARIGGQSRTPAAFTLWRRLLAGAGRSLIRFGQRLETLSVPTPPPIHRVRTA